MDNLQKVLSGKQYNKTITLVEGREGSVSVYKALGEALKKLLTELSDNQTIVSVNSFNNSVDLIDAVFLESIGYETSQVSFGGNLSIRYSPATKNSRARTDLFIYLTSSEDTIDYLHFTKVVVPMLTPLTGRAIVVPPVSGISEVYRELEVDPSTKYLEV